MPLADQLKQSYLDWVNESFEYRQLANGFIRIDTPFTDNNSDGVVLYAIANKNNEIMLTDDGWTLNNLESYGVYTNKSPKRKEMLERQLRLYGVSTDGDDIFIETNISKYAEAKHRLLQSILFVNDMFMLSKSNTTNLFYEDVRKFFVQEKIRTIRDASYTGKSGLTHKFEFSIPGFEDEVPLRLIKVMSTTDNSVFAKAIVTDVVQTRPMVANPANTNFYVMINDHNKTVSEAILSLFKDSAVTPILFSKRTDFLPELTQ